eukprot:394927_1
MKLELSPSINKSSKCSNDQSTVPPSPAAHPKKDLSRLYTQIRSFHTTFILRLFQNRQRYSRQFTYTLDRVGTKDITCCDMILNSPNKFKNRMKTKQNLGEFRETRRSSAFMYKPRPNTFAIQYHYIVNTMIYKLVSIFIAFCSLYTNDICLGFLPSVCDKYVLNYGLSFIFIFLFIEWIFYSITHYNYCLTFFFWLDIIGTISLLIDIPFIFNYFMSHYDTGSYNGENPFTVMQTSNKRVFQCLEMGRMLKLFRIVHLFKQTARNEFGEFKLDVLLRNLTATDITRIPTGKFKKFSLSPFSTKKQRKAERNLFESHDAENILRPKRMGTLIGDRLIQKLMLGVLIKYFMMPIFNVGEID